MRLISAVLVLTVAAAPAMAQTQAPSQDRAEAMAHALDNPMVQAALAGTLSNLAGIVLDTRVGPLAHYAAPEDDIRPDDTLHSIARRRDPQFDKHLQDNARHAVAATATTARDVLEMRDSIDETGRRLRAALAPLREALKASSN